MKKIILLSAIIISTLVSCSTDDAPNYNQKLSKEISTQKTKSDFCISCRETDSVSPNNEIDPVKPKKD